MAVGRIVCCMTTLYAKEFGAVEIGNSETAGSSCSKAGSSFISYNLKGVQTPFLSFSAIEKFHVR
jgi:hypothetical protein